MRFFFECVTCFTVATHSSSSSTTSEEPTTTTTGESRRRRKRTSTKGSSAEWKPSLHMISEDITASTTPKKVVDRKPVSPVASSKTVKRCGSSSVHVNDRSQSHDFSREPLPMVFPAFSAAPFMF